MGVIIRWIQIFRHRRITFNKESKGAAFGRAPQGRGAPLWMLSLLNVIIICLSIWIQRITTPILYSSCMASYIYIYILHLWISPTFLLWVVANFCPTPVFNKNSKEKCD